MRFNVQISTTVDVQLSVASSRAYGERYWCKRTAMAQIFGKQTNWMLRTLFFGLPLIILIVISVAIAFDRSDYITGVGVTLHQPVPFSHEHHAGQLQISCLYCHNQAASARFAQIPSTQVCASCHQKIWPDSPVLQQVLESANSGQPIRWQKVTRVPEFVYFDHQIHIERLTNAQRLGPRRPDAAQISSERQVRNACTLCHGSVETMPLTKLAEPMTMAFCLNCHRDPPRYLREHSIEIRKTDGLESRMDCVTCHR